MKAAAAEIERSQRYRQQDQLATFQEGEDDDGGSTSAEQEQVLSKAAGQQNSMLQDFGNGNIEAHVAIMQLELRVQELQRRVGTWACFSQFSNSSTVCRIRAALAAGSGRRRVSGEFAHSVALFSANLRCECRPA
jgi:hypothetical protein